MDGEPDKLFEALEAAPILGEIEFETRSRKGTKKVNDRKVSTFRRARTVRQVTHLGRQCPDLPCGCVFEEAEWKSACAVVRRSKDAGEPTLCEFIAIVGKLGGHLGRKSDGDPGPQSIWQGLARVRDFACAWHAFHEK